MSPRRRNIWKWQDIPWFFICRTAAIYLPILFFESLPLLNLLVYFKQFTLELFSFLEWIRAWGLETSGGANCIIWNSLREGATTSTWTGWDVSTPIGIGSCVLELVGPWLRNITPTPRSNAQVVIFYRTLSLTLNTEFQILIIVTWRLLQWWHLEKALSIINGGIHSIDCIKTVSIWITNNGISACVNIWSLNIYSVYIFHWRQFGSCLRVWVDVSKFESVSWVWSLVSFGSFTSH